MHPNAVIAIAASANQERLTPRDLRRRGGLRALAAPGLRHRAALERVADRENPRAKGVLLGQHGMITWGDDDKACYETDARRSSTGPRATSRRATGASRRSAGRSTQPLAGRGAPPRCSPRSCPWLRGRVSASSGASSARSRTTRRCCASSTASTRPRLAELGTSCPDHFLRTKIKPLFVDWNPQARGRRRAARRRWTRASRSTARTTRPTTSAASGPSSPADARPEPDGRPHPRPGHDRLGQEQERVARDRRVLQLRDRGDARRGGDRPSTRRCRSRRPSTSSTGRSRRPSCGACRPRRSWTAQVVVVVGAGSGIGKAAAHRAGEGGRARRLRGPARPAAAAGDGAGDRRHATARASAWPARGICGCGPAIGLGCDITDRESVARHARPGRPGLRRPRLASSSPRASSCRRTRTAASRTSSGRSPSASTSPAPTSSPTRPTQILAGAGPAGQPRAHHQRQRGRGQEGQPGLRHQQGRGQPPRARAGGRDGAARPRQRRGAGHRGEGQHHVPARPRDRLAGASTRSPSATMRRPRRCGTSWPSSTPSARCPSTRSPRPTRPRRSSCCSATGCARPPARSSPWTAACTRRSCASRGGLGAAKPPTII